MIVNVASQCGFTKQYGDLQKLHEEYKDQGLVLIGVPSNDFGNQEPGSNKEIKEFCDLAKKINIETIYFADSTGSLDSDQTLRITKNFRKYWGTFNTL